MRQAAVGGDWHEALPGQQAGQDGRCRGQAQGHPGAGRQAGDRAREGRGGLPGLRRLARGREGRLDHLSGAEEGKALLPAIDNRLG